MRPQRRLLLLLGLLALVASWIAFGAPGKPAMPAVVAAVTPRDTADRRASTTSVSPKQPETLATILPLRPRTPSEIKTTDAFASRDWTPPPPPPPPPPPQPPPQAPPLPFTYIGKQLEDDGWVVFLARQDRTYVVRAGEVIESAYKVDIVMPPVLTLTYLPLTQAQTLTIGNAE